MTELENSPLLLHDDDDDDEVPVVGRHKPPRPSTVPRNSILNQASRRRSSARFLRLSTSRNSTLSESHLSDMYKQVIQLNAENKINSQNSWNLQLIENIDKFLTEDNVTVSKNSKSNNNSSSNTHQQQEPSSRVNFTKASCTLDASVKIYSYRVDDVHLTSYKVLANLNRSSSSHNNRNESDDEAAGQNNPENVSRKTTAARSNASNNLGSTIETNLANMNVHKLDAAFDIDPLFHKMSKAFDEGGAKGLLLVNLGVGSNGCNVVFDSSLEESEEERQPTTLREMMVDIGPLKQKVDALLQGKSLENFALVPQLAGLRAEYDTLEAQGFVDQSITSTRQSRRYAPQEEEEQEADKSIHQEALERSRASQGPGVMDSRIDDDDEYACGGFADENDDDFDHFIANHDSEETQRYSSISFAGSMDDRVVQQPTTALLDAMAAGQVKTLSSDYAYWDTNELLNQNNAWAGVAHWKSQKCKNSVVTAKTANRARKPRKTKVLVNLQEIPANLLDLQRPAPRTVKKDPTQWSKAMVEKYTNSDNVLPLDANVTVEELTRLFLRPSHTVTPNKTVGWGQVETMGGGACWDDGSLGGNDDDDDAGYAFGGDDEDIVAVELDGVRKVDKVQVGYATVAKKIDVKRLKSDLWDELETELETLESETKTLSFQNTVQNMEARKTQVDATVPFYFICLLHLANENGLRLESQGLADFNISYQ